MWGCEMSLEFRTTVLDRLKINLMLFSSVTKFGDVQETKSNDRLIAVQRAISDFEGDETRFAAHPLFFRPAYTLPETAPIQMNTASSDGRLYVGWVHAYSMNSSSVIRAGCCCTHRAQARTHHIRHFNNILDIR
jgi:spore germination protein PE